MTDQPTVVLKQQVDKIKKSYEYLEAQIERDESLISEMIDYLSEGKEIDVDKLDFCKSFQPALTFELPVFTFPQSFNDSSHPLQVKAKTLFMIDDEVVVCLKISNTITKSLFDVSASVVVEDSSKMSTMLKSRSIVLIFINKSEEYYATSKQNVSWHKFCPIQTDVVSPNQTAYLIVAFSPPDKAMPCTIVLFCDIGESNDKLSLVSCVEPHKSKHWQGVLIRFVCDPWELNAPNCLTSDSITSPDHFLMNICSLTAFALRKKLKLYHTSKVHNVFALPDFKLEKVSGQTGVLFSKLIYLSGLIVFIQNYDVDPGSFILCGKANAIESFLNKLNSLNIGFETVDLNEDDQNEPTEEILLHEKVKIMKELERFGNQSVDKNVAVDGILLRSLATNLVSLELKRLCLNDQ